MENVSLYESGGQIFLSFLSGPINLLEVRDLKEGVLWKEYGLKICGKAHSSVIIITKSGGGIKLTKLTSSV